MTDSSPTKIMMRTLTDAVKVWFDAVRPIRRGRRPVRRGAAAAAAVTLAAGMAAAPAAAAPPAPQRQEVPRALAAPAPDLSAQEEQVALESVRQRALAEPPGAEER